MIQLLRIESTEAISIQTKAHSSRLAYNGWEVGVGSRGIQFEGYQSINGDIVVQDWHGPCLQRNRPLASGSSRRCFQITHLFILEPLIARAILSVLKKHQLKYSTYWIKVGSFLMTS
jgi:hypothetical protein